MNRVTPIDARMLERFEQGYAARPELNVMSNAVSRTALPDAAFVPAAAAKLRMDFSVLVKTNNIQPEAERPLLDVLHPERPAPAGDRQV